MRLQNYNFSSKKQRLKPKILNFCGFLGRNDTGLKSFWLFLELKTLNRNVLRRLIRMDTRSNELITRLIGMETRSFLQNIRPIEKAAHPMWVRRLIMNGCVSGKTADHTVFTRSSSPVSCGRRSCSGAEPSSGPRRRAPRPRWDKPSSLTGSEPRPAGSRGS